MQSQYVYRMRPLIIPGLSFIILYPLLIGFISYYLALPDLFVRIFSGIYILALVIIVLIWLTAKTKKIIVDDQNIIFQSLLGKDIIQPKDIRKASFFWTSKDQEIVQLKVGKKIYYLSDLYFPFNDLLTDLEEFIIHHNIRSNLASHYGME